MAPPALFLSALLLGCGEAPEPGSGTVAGEMDAVAPVRLGPVDGRDLPPTEVGRVAVGMEAPDFSLRSLTGATVTLSDFRGRKDVVLVFYRGHW